MSNKIHNPHHIYIDNSPYFISSATYQKRHLLRSDKVKEYLLDTIQKCFTEKNWQLKGWVILDNHYHLMLISHQGKDLSKIMAKIHMLSARFICSEIDAEKPIWWNYWDYCPRDEKDYFVRLNYLFNNPVKHGYVANLADYPYSSFQQMLKQQGREKLVQQFKKYQEYKQQYKQLNLDEDNF